MIILTFIGVTLSIFFENLWLRLAPAWLGVTSSQLRIRDIDVLCNNTLFRPCLYQGWMHLSSFRRCQPRFDLVIGHLPTGHLASFSIIHIGSIRISLPHRRICQVFVKFPNSIMNKSEEYIFLCDDITMTTGRWYQFCVNTSVKCNV